MKKIGCISGLFLGCFLFTSTLKAQTYNTAIGIRISSQAPVINNSITLKHFFSNTIAAEGLVSFGDPFAIGVLIEKHSPLLGGGSFSWFRGGGAYVGFSGNNTFGLQGVIGLDYRIPTLPINFSLDWKPELNIVNQFGFEAAAVGFSARFVLR